MATNEDQSSPFIEQRISLVAESSLLVPHGANAHSALPGCIGSDMPDPSAFCVALTVGGIPVGATVDRVRLFVRERDADEWVESQAKHDAPIGWCQFVGNY